MTEKTKKLFKIDIKHLDGEIKALNYELNKAALKQGDLKGKYSAASVDYIKTVKACINELCKQKQELIQVIESVENPTYRKLLRLRYLECKTIEQIADEMFYSCEWVKRLHKRALNDIRR